MAFLKLIKDLSPFLQFWDPEIAPFLPFLDPEFFCPFLQFLDPETAVFLQFLDPETAPFLQFLGAYGSLGDVCLAPAGGPMDRRARLNLT